MFESGFSKDEKKAAVQYLKFPVDRRMAAALGRTDNHARVIVSNGRYRAEPHLGVITRNELLRDLADPV